MFKATLSGPQRHHREVGQPGEPIQVIPRNAKM